jgi:dihydropteroate synthase
MWDLPEPAVMGVLNVTPDSFSDGGRFTDLDAAVAHGRALYADGAHVVDVGGESTRPGAEPVDEAEERRRVVPVIEALADLPAPISVDTTKASVAAAALEAGALIVNDVSAGRLDPGMLETVAAAGAGYVVMHMQGEPRTMQDDPRYDDVVAEVSGFLVERVDAAVTAGVDPDRIWADPGIGFGKTLAHNLTLLARLDEVVQRVDVPLLVGTSRKGFIGEITGSGVEDRDDGTLATVVWAVERGAAAVRVHDVAGASRTLRLLDVTRRATQHGVGEAA